VRIRVYVEGGGDQKRTLDLCRQAFAKFFSKVAPPDNRPRVIPCGGRRATFDDFCNALKTHRDEFVLLLVDSEGPVGKGASVWDFLHNRSEDGWTRPAAAEDQQAHLMVQCMEAWLIADKERVCAFYGDGFLKNSLPQRPEVELIPKLDLIRAIEHASAPTQKGQYHKIRHGFNLLEQIDAVKVGDASPHAAQLFSVLKAPPR
jgi:Domain of unknown function (DUF4276)